jgi:hypothetical protein
MMLGSMAESASFVSRLRTMYGLVAGECHAFEMADDLFGSPSAQVGPDVRPEWTIGTRGLEIESEFCHGTFSPSVSADYISVIVA